jgi:predicted transcriptional regulator
MQKFREARSKRKRYWVIENKKSQLQREFRIAKISTIRAYRASGATWQEIAQELGLPESSVRRYYQLHEHEVTSSSYILLRTR